MQKGVSRHCHLAAHLAVAKPPAVADWSWSVQMSSSVTRNPVTPQDDFRSEQNREFERWRVAAEIARRFREAGISCELNVGNDRH
jgi:hypothetical protein